MQSPFPGMDPFLEQNPIFHELHTQMLAEAQAQLQPQLRPKYVARLERHLSEGSVWDIAAGMISLAGKEPDLTIASVLIRNLLQVPLPSWPHRPPVPRKIWMLTNWNFVSNGGS
jgi:hypothetical protein